MNLPIINVNDAKDYCKSKTTCYLCHLYDNYKHRCSLTLANNYFEIDPSENYSFDISTLKMTGMI